MDFFDFNFFEKKIKAPWSKYYKNGEMNIKIPNTNVYNYFEQKVYDLGYRYCIDYYGNKFKYNELLRKIDECAKGLYNLGVRKGDVVTVCLPNTIEGVVSFFAINKIGAIVNFIHPASSENEIKDSLNETNSRVLILIDTNYLKFKSIENEINVNKIILVNIYGYMPFITSFRHKFEKKIKINSKKDNLYIWWNLFLLKSRKLQIEDYTVVGKKDAPAIILHSGGTTGSPKGIVLSNGNLIAFVESATIGQDYLVNGDTCLALMPIFHGFGIIHSILYPLCIGMNVVLRPKFDVKEYCDMIIKYKPQILMGVPSLFESLLKEWGNRKVNLDFIKCILVGGDVLKQDLRKRINSFLKENNAKISVSAGYGLSEAVCGVALGHPTFQKEGTIGIPLPGIYVGIFSSDDKEVPYGEVGEICVSGLTVMLGYYKNEDETKLNLHIHSDKQVWLHTGDLGSMDEDGFITVEGRSKRMIISSGYNVYPSRIEKLLETHSAVSACSVVGISHKYKMEVPKAYIVLKERKKKKELLILEFKKMCYKNLPKYSWPCEYEFIDELPKTKVGKIDYKKLQEKNEDGE